MPPFISGLKGAKTTLLQISKFDKKNTTWRSEMTHMQCICYPMPQDLAIGNFKLDLPYTI